jgi:hypothetical protein
MWQAKPEYPPSQPIKRHLHLADLSRLHAGNQGVFDFMHLVALASWPGYGQPEFGPNGTSACV